MVIEAVQVVAAAAILGAYGCSQMGVVNPRSPRYLVPNMLGASVLAAQALLMHEPGFLLLEGAWAAISARGLVTEIRTTRA
jgi:hypothetical protein